VANKFTIWINSVADTKGLSSVVSGLEKIRDRIASMAKGALVAGIGAVTAGIWQLTSALKAFARQELSEFDMESALKQMGQYTDQYRDKLIRLSQQYQQSTNIGDEMWLKTFAQLTRFGMHAGNVDKVAEATKNLAALMDGNLQGAMLAMQRALEGEFSMFSRYGIKLDLTGDKVKDLDNLMVMLAQKGGGLLEARAETLSGKLSGLRNAISDFREEVGRTITESTGLKDGLDFLRGKFNELEESAKSGTLHEILKQAGAAVRNWAKQIADVVDQIDSVQALKVVAEEIGAWLKEKLIEAGVEISNFLATKAPEIGWMIGKAAFEAMLPGSKDSMSNAQTAAAREAATEGGQHKVYSKEWRANYKEIRLNTEAENRKARWEKENSSKNEISDASPRSLKDRIDSRLDAYHAGREPSVLQPQQTEAARWQKQADSFSNIASQLGDTPEGNAARALAEESQQKAVALLSEIEELSKSAGDTLESSVAAVDLVTEINAKQLAILSSLVSTSNNMSGALDAISGSVSDLTSRVTAISNRVRIVEGSAREARL